MCNYSVICQIMCDDLFMHIAFLRQCLVQFNFLCQFVYNYVGGCYILCSNAILLLNSIHYLTKESR